jgi:hypothetical protein
MHKTEAGIEGCAEVIGPCNVMVPLILVVKRLARTEAIRIMCVSMKLNHLNVVVKINKIN